MILSAWGGRCSAATCGESICQHWAGLPGSEYTTPLKECSASWPRMSATRGHQGSDRSSTPNSDGEMGISQRPGERCTISKNPAALPIPTVWVPSASVISRLRRCDTSRRCLTISASHMPGIRAKPSSVSRRRASSSDVTAVGVLSPFMCAAHILFG